LETWRSRQVGCIRQEIRKGTSARGRDVLFLKKYLR
jgi:hypothetical protein